MLGLTHYEVLNVPADCSGETLKAAYRLKLLESHPDKGGLEKYATVTQIKLAYQTLNDPESRKTYDKELAESFKKQGFSVTGAGLDVYTLDSFEEADNTWNRNCPRCLGQMSILLTEHDLEMGTPDGLGGYQIMAPCQNCSLWITVVYEEG